MVRDDRDDLFPGFTSESVMTRSGRVATRVGGSGPPLLLLHGYPQTHVMWHRVVPLLTDRYTVVLCDLPGYGESEVPMRDETLSHYTKRAMASAMVEVMTHLGFDRFAVAGHDRGGRVAYRLALDLPDRVSRIAVLDILPTYEYWARLDREFGLKIHHWLFLAQPAPVPERLISADPDAYFGPVFDAAGADGTPIFDPVARDHYLKTLRDPNRVGASCDDYRAGAHADVEHDREDWTAARRIQVPVLALWGETGVPTMAVDDPELVWRRWADHVTAVVVPGGHFVCEESPEAVATALVQFLSKE